MEATSDGKVEIDSSDKGKKERNWGHAFYNFLVSGGIVFLLFVAAMLAIAIVLLIG